MTEETYATIENVLEWLVDHRLEHPELSDLAKEVGLSPHHLQRVFKRWVGISPKKYLQFLTLEDAKRRLAASASVLDATYDVGLSGPGRLHDLFVSFEAMTPGEYKTGASDIEIRYGFHATPFGECMLAITCRGICGLGFVIDGDKTACLEDFRARWPGAAFIEAPERTARQIEQIFTTNTGPREEDAAQLKLFVRGSAFQVKVWEALLTIPAGHLTTYSDLAERMGKGRQAARAVGGAVGANPISWLIPCHRVIRESGALSGYHWGLPRKLGMIGWEAATSNKAEEMAIAGSVIGR